MIDYPTLLQTFKQLLKDNGLKFTNQREVILKMLYEHDDHFTPEALHHLIKDNYPQLNVGIATVYRTLGLLEDNGIINSISFDAKGKKYEFGLKKHHDHLICTRCGKLIEFYDKMIEEQQKLIAKNFHFLMTDHTMNILGICETCQKANKPQEKI
jgi:Fur family ferric uptake transcriptional regulator